MSDKTPRLGLPYILTGQAQKEITHNEALNLLDAVVQLSVLDRDLAAPPAAPAAGDRYLVAAGASGAWVGRDGQIALWQTAWLFLAPVEGWQCWVMDEDLLLRHDGAGWVPFATSFGLTLINQSAAAGARAALGLGSIATLAAPAGDVVGTTDAQTLSSKSLSDATLGGTTALASGHGFAGNASFGGAAGTRILNARSSAGYQLRLERNGSSGQQAGIELFDGGGVRGQMVSNGSSIQLIHAETVVAQLFSAAAPRLPPAYGATTASAANVFVDTDGSLRRSTSSERYKTAIEPVDPAHSTAVIYGAEPIWYRSLCDGDDPAWSWYGLSAEREAARDPRMVLWRSTELVEESFEELEPVTEPVRIQLVEVIDGRAVLTTQQAARPVFDEVPVEDADGNPVLVADAAGRMVPMTHRQPRLAPVTRTRKVPRPLETPVPDGIHYPEYVPHLIVIAQRQRDQIAALEARVAALEATST